MRRAPILSSESGRLFSRGSIHPSLTGPVLAPLPTRARTVQHPYISQQAPPSGTDAREGRAVAATPIFDNRRTTARADRLNPGDDGF